MYAKHKMPWKEGRSALAFVSLMRKKGSYADNVYRIEENMAGGEAASWQRQYPNGIAQAILMAFRYARTVALYGAKALIILSFDKRQAEMPG